MSVSQDEDGLSNSSSLCVASSLASEVKLSLQRIRLRRGLCMQDFFYKQSSPFAKPLLPWSMSEHVSKST